VDVDVDLDGLEQALAGAAPAADRVEDEQDVVPIGVELGALAELDRVLDRDGVEPERLAERLDLVLAGVGEIEPEELVALAQAGELLAVDGLEDVPQRASLSGGATVGG
jgi:hypothetical protein